jgi:hypothetical protein
VNSYPFSIPAPSVECPCELEKCLKSLLGQKSVETYEVIVILLEEVEKSINVAKDLIWKRAYSLIVPSRCK